MNLEEDLIKTTEEISHKEKELGDLKHKRYQLELEIKKLKSTQEVKDFIVKNGNILNKKLHNELRLKLIDTLYGGKEYASSYDMVLHLILDKLDVKHQYLDIKDSEDVKWSLLQIYI